jgi:hypothetical protein
MSDDALFGIDHLTPDPKAGRVEKALLAAVAAARESGTLIEQDAGLVAGAMVAARALDFAEQLMRIPAAGTKGGYLVAQLLTPYRESLHALRLPAELTPATPPAPEPAKSHSDVPDWLSDAFGTPE